MSGERWAHTRAASARRGVALHAARVARAARAAAARRRGGARERDEASPALLASVLLCRSNAFPLRKPTFGGGLKSVNVGTRGREERRRRRPAPKWRPVGGFQPATSFTAFAFSAIAFAFSSATFAAAAGARLPLPAPRPWRRRAARLGLRRLLGGRRRLAARRRLAGDLRAGDLLARLGGIVGVRGAIGVGARRAHVAWPFCEFFFRRAMAACALRPTAAGAAADLHAAVGASELAIFRKCGVYALGSRCAIAASLVTSDSWLPSRRWLQASSASAPPAGVRRGSSASTCAAATRAPTGAGARRRPIRRATRAPASRAQVRPAARALRGAGGEGGVALRHPPRLPGDRLEEMVRRASARAWTSLRWFSGARRASGCSRRS